MHRLISFCFNAIYIYNKLYTLYVVSHSQKTFNADCNFRLANVKNAELLIWLVSQLTFTLVKAEKKKLSDNNISKRPSKL